MEIGIGLQFANWYPGLSDSEMYHAELALAEKAESFGFDTIWCVEHHFESYALCPDNVTLLAYLAGRTNTIKLATGAVILPWNEPLRVVEKMTMLDALARGRVVFGIGRGLARREYGSFGLDMGESRERF
jgi:alkanesulfonate monooxygenase SsuD/methylene tetrahydromethanopterin reductase-like flavin-dependent oxidoreductase (luciferase family)